MINHSATFSPAHWTPAGPGAWTKNLLRSEGDSFTLIRLASDAAFDPSATTDDRILVLDGELSIDGTTTTVVRTASRAESCPAPAGVWRCC